METVEGGDLMFLIIHLEQATEPRCFILNHSLFVCVSVSVHTCPLVDLPNSTFLSFLCVPELGYFTV